MKSLALSLTKARTGPYQNSDALVAELVDALVSGTSGESRGGSSPLLGTKWFVGNFSAYELQILGKGAGHDQDPLRNSARNP
jgi:hypothetical protein